jgi:hypothetical protein
MKTGLIYTALQEKFFTDLRVAMFGGIFLGFARQSQQNLDHVLHLSLVGSALAHYGLFDLAGGVLVNLQPAVGSSYNGCSPGLPQLQRRIRVTGHENLFDSEFPGSVFTDQRRQAVKDGLQAFRHGFFANPDATAVNVLDHPAFDTNYAIAGNA